MLYSSVMISSLTIYIQHPQNLPTIGSSERKRTNWSHWSYDLGVRQKCIYIYSSYYCKVIPVDCGAMINWLVNTNIAQLATTTTSTSFDYQPSFLQLLLLRLHLSGPILLYSDQGLGSWEHLGLGLLNTKTWFIGKVMQNIWGHLESFATSYLNQ